MSCEDLSNHIISGHVHLKFFSFSLFTLYVMLFISYKLHESRMYNLFKFEIIEYVLSKGYLYFVATRDLLKGKQDSLPNVQQMR